MNRPPALLRFIFSLYCNPDKDYSFLGDIEEYYNEILLEKGKAKAVVWYIVQIIKAVPPLIRESLFWRSFMLGNYTKIALRNLRKKKGYSFINIFGLAAGITCCFFILLYVENEITYDSYHPDAGRVYRIANEQVTSGGNRYYSSVLPILSGEVKKQFPQVLESARIMRMEPQTIRSGDLVYYEENLSVVDPEIFNIFSLPVIQGDPAEALSHPFSMIMTESMAKKYFAADDPIGRTVYVDTMQMTVNCIIKDSPQNTHYKFGIIGSVKLMELSYAEMNHMFLEWTTGMHTAHTYVKLAKDTDIDSFTGELNRLTNAHLKEELAKAGYQHNYFLQPLQSIHLYSDFRYELEPPGNPLVVKIMGVIGVLVLLIACMNFINLATARSLKRSNEVGLRKIVGAQRKQLIAQYMCESVIISVIASLISFAAIVLLLPWFNDFSGLRFTQTSLFRLPVLSAVAILALLSGMVSGIYPALFLSSYSPLKIIKSSYTSVSRGAVVRKVLVVGQYVISIVLIAGTLVIFKQISYMKNFKLGFNKEHKVVVSLPKLSMVRYNYGVIKNDFMKDSVIKGVTASSTVPGREYFYWRTWPSGERADKSQAIYFMNVDYDFIDQFEMEMVAGRKFDVEFGSDQYMEGVIFNESAVAAFGWEASEALTKTINANNKPVIGVVKDFHFKGLQTEVEPMAMSVWSDHFRCFTLTIDGSEIPYALNHIEEVFRKHFPDEIFDYFFLDTDFNRQYKYEERTATMFSSFTMLGIIIACLGILGLVSYTAEQRTREIGIRKVLGANVYGLIVMIIREFVIWIALAALIAWPVTWYSTNTWLSDFAYRIEPGFSLYLSAVLISLFIAVFTVIYQAYKAANADPVESLRYE